MKNPKCVLHSLAGLVAAATVWSQPPATAGSSGAGTGVVKLEPLRVTADLWEAPLERISASVSVYDDRSLRTGDVRHFADLVDQIPNFTWTGGTSRPRYFQIRGVGENSQYEGETPDSTVRFLVDDFDFTGLGGLAGTFDVRQVEVLRGPQAGAFGANAAAGLVRLVTNAPTPFWSGQAEGTVGEDGLREGGFAVGGPLVAGRPERLMARLAVHRHVSDGFRRNVTLQRDANGRDETTARLRLAFQPNPGWSWDLGLIYADLDNGFDDFALDNNGVRTFSNRPGRDEQEALGASVRGAFSGWPGLRLTTVTSAAWVDSVYSYDDDWTPGSYDGFSDLARERRVFGEELRLDSTPARGDRGWIDRWTLGLFLSRTREQSRYTNEDPGNLRGLATAYRGTHGALFGQVGHDFSPRSRLIVGMRLERVDLNGSGTRTRLRKARGTYDPEVRFAPAFADTLFGGKVTFEHDLTARHLGFLSITRGYKAGGINVDARINPPADPLTYATEALWNIEAGVRGSWWRQRLVGEFTAFRMERRDAQVRDSAGFGGSYRFFTANGNDASVHGVEASGNLALSATWSLFGSVGWMESDLARFTLANGSVGGGRELANAPRHSYSLGVRRSAETGWFGRAEIVGRARQYDSNNHDEPREAFTVVNANLGYAWRDWSVTLWARNAFDEEYQKRVFFFGNEDPDYVPTRYESRADPRQFGATLRYRF